MLSIFKNQTGGLHIKYALSLLLLCILSHGSFGQIGTPDNNFGNNGYVQIDQDVKGFSIDSRGRMVLVYQVSSKTLRVTRLLSNGQVDLSFAQSGSMEWNSPDQDVSSNDLKIAFDENNDIFISCNLLSGYSFDKGAIISINSEGSFTYFGDNGFLVTGLTAITDMLVQKSGKVVVIGVQLDMERFNTDGTKDETFVFENSGSVMYNFYKLWKNEHDDIYILVYHDSTILKINKDGQYIDGFGNMPQAGHLLIEGFNSMHQIYPLQDFIYVLGYDTNSSLVLSKVFNNGNLDTSFGYDGFFWFESKDPTGHFRGDLFVDEVGRIMVYGGIQTPDHNYSYQMNIYLVNPTGTLASRDVSDQLIHVGVIRYFDFSLDGRLLYIGEDIDLTQIIKVDIKNRHNYTLPSIPTRYLSSLPYALPAYEKPEYLTLEIENPEIAIIHEGNLLAQKVGITTLTATLKEDKDYYPLTINRTVKVEAIPPAVVSGRGIVPSNTDEIFSIIPYNENITYIWRYSDENIFTRPGANQSIHIYFPKDAKDGVLTCSYFIETPDGLEEVIVLEKQITINNSYGLIDELADVICPQEIGICHNNYIDGFRINNLSNEGSGCTMGAYMDYTRSSYTTDLVTETIYSAQADVVESSGVNVYVGLWLDYNNDGDFNGPYEFLGSSYTADQTIVFPNIKIQKNQDFLGDRRLRIRCRTSGPFSAADFCMSPGEEGETEDYRVTIVEPEPLLAPELVTPNNDGYNDAFVIRGMNEHLENKLMIMDRFGSVKYKKDDYRNTWEGQHQNGEILPQGTYYYVFTQGKSVIKGFFELMY